MVTDIERSKLPSAANILLILGMIALIGSFFVPSLIADRVARIEGRGLMIARDLLVVALQMEPFDLSEPESIEQLIASLRHANKDQGLPNSNLPILAQDVRDSQPDRLYLTSKHYRFLLTREPHPEQPSREFVFLPERRPFEVYAWPRAEIGAARSAFYCPEDGLVAYSRNLLARYRGLDRMPSPGSAMPPSGIVPKAGDRRGYRGQGNHERWLPLGQS